MYRIKKKGIRCPSLTIVKQYLEHEQPGIYSVYDLDNMSPWPAVVYVVRHYTLVSADLSDVLSTFNRVRKLKLSDLFKPRYVTIVKSEDKSG